MMIFCLFFERWRPGASARPSRAVLPGLPGVRGERQGGQAAAAPGAPRRQLRHPLL